MFRILKRKKIEITVLQSNLIYCIYTYNQFMGGIDQTDQNTSLYQTSIHGEKVENSIFSTSSRCR